MGAELTLAVVDAVDDAEWDELVRRDPRAHTLQRPIALRCVAAAGWRPRWFEVRDGAGVLRAGLGCAVRTRVGLSTVIAGLGGLYGGPVAGPDDAEAEAIMAEGFARRGRLRVVHRELVWGRQDPPRGDWKGLRALDAAVLDVDPTAPFDRFLKGIFPRNRRNEGNRSDRRGLRIEIHTASDVLAEFHPLYVERCREWGTPPLPLEFMAALVDTVDEALVFVTRDADERVAGAHVCVDLGDELFAWVGTTERRKDVFPSTVLVREEARWCHEHGRTRLNLGSSIGRAGIEGYKKLLGARWDRRWIVDEDRRPWRRRSR